MLLLQLFLCANDSKSKLRMGLDSKSNTGERALGPADADIQMYYLATFDLDFLKIPVFVRAAAL